MLLLLKQRKEQITKLIEYFFKEKSNFNQNTKYYTLVRFKNKHSEDIYLEKLNKSLNNTIICITPYLSRLTFRFEHYLDYLKTNNRNYFINMPRINFLKAFKKALNISLSSFPHDLKIALFDIIIQRIKIDDLVIQINKNFPDIREFYTDDNYNFGKTYLTERLKESNIKVIGYSHGVGLQSPLVNFDVFYVLSKMQRSFYLGNSKFKYFHFDPSIEKKDNNSKKPFALFFICQNIFSYESPKFTAIYQTVITFIEQIVKEYDFPVFAKYHPGSTDNDKILSEKILIIEKIEDLPSDYNYLAITLSSTYAIELINIMPFLVINPQKKINLKYLFPENNHFYVNNYQEFKRKIEKLLKNPQYYNEYWEKLSNSIM